MCINMRYNKQELAALASQTFQNFDREGVLVLKEKSDGFFRRSEGCSVRWFRLKGNLLFYLKGPEPLHEPLGVIVLGQHTVKEQNQDENGHWPFHIVWENGVCYRIATYNEADRTNWINAIQNAPYSVVQSQLTSLKERLNSIRSIMDIATYRIQKGIVFDITEIPICELALSCDNLLCDAYGKPPNPLIVVYVRYSKEVCIKYGTTEVVEACSNPCFSKTIMFRGSDGLTGEVIVKIVVYDVKEQVTETAVPMGSTSLRLSTIQEAQRLRVSLMNREKKTIGFVTIHGWSLEPSHLGASPSHSEENNSTDVSQKVLCHRRSQSLPPRLGFKLKFPSFGSLLKQNFVNGHQVTYRFHSGLGGDITVHEIMLEAKLCYQIPMQLLDIYIEREKRLLRELTSIKNLSDQWQSRQADLANSHVALLDHYGYLKRSLQTAENTYFKPSSKKDDPSLEFAPVNLHIQRMWVHNDTLNRTGFYNVVTAGAFAVHEQKNETSGGLIRLLQQVKDVNRPEAASDLANANKIQANYENMDAIRHFCRWALQDMRAISDLLQNKRYYEISPKLKDIKRKIEIALALWEPAFVEETLASIGWPKNDLVSNIRNEKMLSAILNRRNVLIAKIAANEAKACARFEELLLADKKRKREITIPAPDAAVAIVNQKPNLSKASTSASTDLQFYNDHFESKDTQNPNISSGFLNPPVLTKLDENKSPSPGKTPSDSVTDYLMGNENKQIIGLNIEPMTDDGMATPSEILDPSFREKKLKYLTQLETDVKERTEQYLRSFVTLMSKVDDYYVTEELWEDLREEVMVILTCLLEDMKLETDLLINWAKVGHAALRIKCESPALTKEHAALQIRRDTCFSQALTTVTAGILCWFNSVPGDVIVKLLTSDLGPLCGFEGLLSLYSTEKAMWGDMVVAVEDLQTVVFVISKVDHSNSAIPHVSGTRDALYVNIPVSDWIYSKLMSKKQNTFKITAVFFNIGINEKATLAEEHGQTTPQYQSNCDNLDRLNKYYHKYNKVFPADHTAASRASSRTKPLEEVMENLRTAVQKKVPKNVEVLHLSSLATRLMNGVRFTSCKSAKDRTSMAVTLEQCNILASEYHLAENEMKKALNIMRSEGCRRENTFKNIAVRKYAFTKKQVMALPEEYQPPPGTYGSTET